MRVDLWDWEMVSREGGAPASDGVRIVIAGLVNGEKSPIRSCSDKKNIQNSS